MKYLIFGSLNIDYKYIVETIATNGKTIMSYNESLDLGGKGFNQAIALARATENKNIYFAGSIGKDGERLKNKLVEEGVDVSLIKKSLFNTGKAIIQIDKNGDNSIIVYPGANNDIDKKYIDNVLSKFNKGDIIILQNEISNVDYIAKIANLKGMIVVYNPSPYNERASLVNLDKVDYLFINEIEGEEISNKNEPKEIIKSIHVKHPELNIILTLGDKGSMFMDKNGNLYMEGIYNTEVRDTTSAGDTYTGYFIGNIGLDPHETMMIAKIASGISVSRLGSSDSIPKKSDVNTIVTCQLS